MCCLWSHFQTGPTAATNMTLTKPLYAIFPWITKLNLARQRGCYRGGPRFSGRSASPIRGPRCHRVFPRFERRPTDRSFVGGAPGIKASSSSAKGEGTATEKVGAEMATMTTLNRAVLFCLFRFFVCLFVSL